MAPNNKLTDRIVDLSYVYFRMGCYASPLSVYSMSRLEAFEMLEVCSCVMYLLLLIPRSSQLVLVTAGHTITAVQSQQMRCKHRCSNPVKSLGGDITKKIIEC